MDKPRTINPLLQPADEVLKSVIYLEPDVNFQVLISWIGACYSAAVHAQPTIRDDIELRWSQGRSQALLLINKVLTTPRVELQARQQDAEKNKLSRNP